MIDRDKILIFQHLAKTGGTTLAEVFQRNFAPEERLGLQPGATQSVLGTWLMDDVRRAVDAQPPEAWDTIRLVGGHLGFGVHSLLPRPACYVTLLRDPVSRLISGYYYYYATRGRDVPPERRIPLEDYVFRKEHYDLGLNNYQVRLLSGLPDLDPTGAVTTENARPITEEDFARVLENCRNHYAFIGLTERFDESLVVLCGLLGWGLSEAVYQRQNITTSRPPLKQIPNRVVAEIERHNAYDRRLYALRQTLFAGYITDYGPSFEEDVAFFRLLNRLYEQGVPQDELRGMERQRRAAALIAAAANGHLEILRHLHERGADIHGEDHAPLRMAAGLGRLEVVRYLHQQGADVCAQRNDALRRAASQGHLEVVHYLHEHGAALTACDKDLLQWLERDGHHRVARYIRRGGGDLRAFDDAGVIRAAGKGDVETLKELLAMGADPAAGGGEALRVAAEGGHLPAVKLLLNHGADVRAGGDAALRAAVAEGHVEVVRFLHRNGGDIGAVDGEALCRAAARRQGDMIRYLHPNGITHSLLTEEGRKRIQDMVEEIQAAPPIYHPSRFWETHNAAAGPLLAWGGECNFKRTVNQFYSTYIPTSLVEPRILNLLRLWLRHRSLKPFSYEIKDPDCDPGLWLSWYPDYFIFKGDRDFLLRLYKWFVGSLYEYGLKTDRHGVLARLEEPELGNPIRVRRDGKLVSQDLVNSVRERNVIVDGLSGADAGRPLVIAELGAGYGRLGYVLLATSNCRYMVFDIPPALHISEWYLSRLFPQKRIFRFRRFRSYPEVAGELAQADIAFFTANQLELLPDLYVDAFATISSLHEMHREQIDHFLALMAGKTRDLIYIKQYRRYVNPYDALVIRRSDYTIPAGWRVAMERADALNPSFFQLLLRRDVKVRRPGVTGERLRPRWWSRRLAGYDRRGGGGQGGSSRSRRSGPSAPTSARTTAATWFAGTT